MKKIIAATIVGIMLLSIAGCAKKIERVRKGDFEDAIEEVFDDDEYGTYADSVYVYDDHYAINFSILDEDDAEDIWEECLEDYDDMIEDNDFHGRTRRVDTDTYGYILLNGELDDDDFLGDRDYVYGGIFYIEDEYIAVLTDKDKDDYRDNVDTILDALGFPHP